MATATVYKILDIDVTQGKRGFPGPGGVSG